MQMWKTFDLPKSQFSGLKHFQIFSRQITQSGSFLTIVARTIEFSPFLIKFAKFKNLRILKIVLMVYEKMSKTKKYTLYI